MKITTRKLIWLVWALNLTHISSLFAANDFTIDNLTDSRYHAILYSKAVSPNPDPDPGRVVPRLGILFNSKQIMLPVSGQPLHIYRNKMQNYCTSEKCPLSILSFTHQDPREVASEKIVTKAYLEKTTGSLEKHNLTDKTTYRISGQTSVDTSLGQYICFENSANNTITIVNQRNRCE